MRHITAFTLFFTLAAMAAYTATAQSGRLTLEDIYKNHEYAAKGITAFRWTDDGHSFLTLEKDSATNGQNLVLNDIRTGEKTIAVAASSLIPQTTPCC